eukprot:979015-Pyramimonas_sp.AAC.1
MEERPIFDEYVARSSDRPVGELADVMTVCEDAPPVGEDAAAAFAAAAARLHEENELEEVAAQLRAQGQGQTVLAGARVQGLGSGGDDS